MSAVDTAVPNGHSEANGNGPELTRAQKLMQQHDHEHQPSIEEVPDEEDLKHGEQPTSTSVLEDVNGDSTAPGWVPTVSTKAAGKQKEDARKEPSIDTQSHELFPALGATSQPKPQVQGIWGGGKSPANANGTPTNEVSRASTPISGAATPLSTVNRPKVNQPGQQHQERIELAKDHILKRDQLKKPLPEILREVNKKYRSNITQTTGLEGKMTFTAYGPPAASRTGIKALMEQIGAKVSWMLLSSIFSDTLTSKKSTSLSPAKHEPSSLENRAQRSRSYKKLLVLEFKCLKTISLALSTMTKMPQ